MSRFADGGGFDFSDEDENFDYDDDYVDEDEHEAIMSAAIPAELMHRWKQSEVDLETQRINTVVLRQVIVMLERSYPRNW